MSDFRMYLVIGNLRTALSEGASRGDAGYNPVQLEVDSTNIAPQPSSTAVVEVELDEGFFCQSFSLTFEGTNANSWEITDSNPLIDNDAVWQPGLAGLSIPNGETVRVWVRAKTFFEETPSTDISVKLVPEGRIEAV